MSRAITSPSEGPRVESTYDLRLASQVPRHGHRPLLQLTALRHGALFLSTDYGYSCTGTDPAPLWKCDV